MANDNTKTVPTNLPLCRHTADAVALCLWPLRPLFRARERSTMSRRYCALLRAGEKAPAPLAGTPKTISAISPIRQKKPNRKYLLDANFSLASHCLLFADGSVFAPSNELNLIFYWLFHSLRWLIKNAVAWEIWISLLLVNQIPNQAYCPKRASISMQRATMQETNNKLLTFTTAHK